MIKSAVLMATYNGSENIEIQLDSIRRQTLQPTFVLIRDDGSFDNTVDIVKKYIEKYQLIGWTIKKNEKNLGWRLNFRQLMLDVSSYDVDYVFISDQDDEWFLNKNEIQTDIMEKNENIDVLSSDIEVKSISNEAFMPNVFKFSDSDKNKLSKYPYSLNYVSYRPGLVMCIRKPFLDLVARNYKQNIGTTHDNLFSGLSGIIGNGYNFNVPVVLHVRHDNNASGNLLNIKSSNSEHISVLNNMYIYYDVIFNVLNELNHPDTQKISKFVSFYKERIKNAEDRNIVKTVIQMIFNFKLYNGVGNYFKDIIFIFKK
ncbi:glycosyl transferase family 2 [Streptococcus bovimastitidis]|uniref:Glycosyl transferase family 2 n=1 Tax=Streptococcus bovimastitidis TaxID=1856638 RepID=A0A1L8MPE9_9STRE|nr:glycosyltransferase [Streptococcus bovimastitidis]OJF72650.1 glycosyl transferase family 2 [Streptococcus bovimastitidis]